MIEERQFIELWQKYNRKLFHFLERRAGEDAEDLLQETYLRAHQKLCCVRSAEEAERWLYRVARNLLIDRCRAGSRYDYLENDPPSPYGSPEFAEEPAVALARSLRETAERLPSPHGETLLLADFAGLNHAAIADRLGLSLPAVKARVLRARDALKRALLECCHFELDRFGTVIEYGPRCPSCDLARILNR